MKIIALYSIKGGVGKTAASVNLAHLSARDNFRTLICDLDPQGSSSFYFRVRPHKKLNSSKFLSPGKRLAKFIRGTDYENLDILPSDFSYRYFDIKLNKFKRSKNRLEKVFKKFAKEYDVIFLDCPPNITLLAESIFEAADLVVIPIIPTILSILSFEKLIKFFDESKFKRKKLKAFFSMVENRKNLHKDTMKKMTKNKFFFISSIPYLSEIERMGISREPVTAANFSGSAAQKYFGLWQDIKSHL